MYLLKRFISVFKYQFESRLDTVNFLFPRKQIFKINSNG